MITDTQRLNFLIAIAVTGDEIETEAMQAAIDQLDLQGTVPSRETLIASIDLAITNLEAK